MIGVLFAAAVLLAETTPAAADNPADAAPPAAVKAPPVKVNKDGKVCHTEEVLGSRIPKRVCFTPEEEADRAQQDRLNLQHMQGNNSYAGH